jgi:hypothetical protein
MWANFFMATAGASAALAGLVFVALSVNIDRILAFSHLPARAGATIATLIVVLASSAAELIPQPLFAMGLEILGFAICGWVLKVWASYLTFAARKVSQRPLYEAIVQTVLGQIQMLPFLVAAILLMRGEGAGFYWLAGGAIAVFVFSVFTCWILLVEIRR